MIKSVRTLFRRKSKKVSEEIAAEILSAEIVTLFLCPQKEAGSASVRTVFCRACALKCNKEVIAENIKTKFNT